MGSVVSVKVTGLDNLLAGLQSLEGAEGKKLIRTALRFGAKQIQQQAKADAPKQSGNLAKSIKVKSGGTRQGVVSVKIVTSSLDHLYKGDEFYGAFQEFGWQKVPTYHNEKGQILSKPRGTQPLTHIEGKHFMKAAAAEAASRAVDAFTYKLASRISEALGTKGTK